MKNVNFLKTILIAVVFTSFTVTTFSVPLKTKTPAKQKTTQDARFDMRLSNTNIDLIVTYTNPEQLSFLVKVYDIYGNVLATAPVNDLGGKVAFNLDALTEAGGTGTYTVEMTSTDGGSSKKGTLVIIRF